MLKGTVRGGVDRNNKNSKTRSCHVRRVSSLALHPGSELVVLGGRAAFARCTRCPTSDLPYVHTVYPSHLMYRDLFYRRTLRRHLSSSYPEPLLSFAATSVGPQRIDVSNLFHPPPATGAVELSLAACSRSGISLSTIRV